MYHHDHTEEAQNKNMVFPQTEGNDNHVEGQVHGEQVEANSSEVETENSNKDPTNEDDNLETSPIVRYANGVSFEQDKNEWFKMMNDETNIYSPSTYTESLCHKS